MNRNKTVLNEERRVRASSRDSSALPGNALRCVSFALVRRGPMIININALGQFLKSALSAMRVRSIQEKVIIRHTKSQVWRKKWWKTAFGRTAPLRCLGRNQF